MFCLISSCDPLTFEEAYQETKWRKAMDDEMQAFNKNNTWELTTLPKGHNSIGIKWVFKKKTNAKGEVEKHKAWLVIKGYKQQFGVDYEEVFALVDHLKTVRLLISLAAQTLWKLFQMDVKSTFLNGYLEEKVFVEQPPCFIIKGHEEKVYKLKRALYRLKQAFQAWNSRINSYFIGESFLQVPM